MAVFPATNPCPRYGTKDTKIRFNKRADFEANYSQLSPKTTRGRRRFELNYDFITEAEFETLESLFDDVSTIYEFTYPLDGLTYSVYIDQDQLIREAVTNSRVNTSIILQEV